MKIIELPTSNTVSFTLTPDESIKAGIIMPDGLKHISLGNLDPAKFKELEIARENGTKVMWATTCIEKTIDNMITSYFIGVFNGASTKRDLFRNELLQSSLFQLSLKKHLISKLSNTFFSFKGSDRDKLQNSLKNVILWRNAFAHGSLKLDSKNGVLLSYYSDSPKNVVLDDRFWNTVEATFSICKESLEKLEKIINSKGTS